MSKQFKQLATSRNIWITFAIIVFINAILFPRAAAAIGGAGPIDLMTSYTPAVVFAAVDSYGPEGRAAYVTNQVVTDTIYPLVYAFFYGAILINLTAKTLPADSGWQKLYLLPFLMMLADFGENIGIVSMLKSYPNQSVQVAQIANIFTMVKWGSFAIVLLATLVLLVRWLAQRNRPTA